MRIALALDYYHGFLMHWADLHVITVVMTMFSRCQEILYYAEQSANTYTGKAYATWTLGVHVWKIRETCRNDRVSVACVSDYAHKHLRHIHCTQIQSQLSSPHHTWLRRLLCRGVGDYLIQQIFRELAFQLPRNKIALILSPEQVCGVRGVEAISMILLFNLVVDHYAFNLDVNLRNGPKSFDHTHSRFYCPCWFCFQLIHALWSQGEG